MWIDKLVLEQCHKQLACISWVPESGYVVLGNANKFEAECKVEHCEADSVPVLRRTGGGGAVVLHSGCVILSVGMWVKHYYRNSDYFRAINDSVITTLRNEYAEFSDLSQDGISDITLKGRKIAGTSLYRSRNYLMYQASILVDTQLHLIDRYLGHPTKEPEYRSGKAHGEFLSSLSEFNKNCTPESIKNIFEKNLVSNLAKELEEHLHEPQEDQLKYLRTRFA
jgi:lipoate-protein ligase A